MNRDAILKFIVDEVQRQGYDTHTSIGLDRVGCMARAWADALHTSSGRGTPSVRDIVELGHLVEPGKNLGMRFRHGPVWIGGRECPPANQLDIMMMKWTEDVERGEMSSFTEDGPWRKIFADTAYVAFERIHPFFDGNGRVGKIIHNWLNGTLHDPVLVPDYFGGGNP